jgi:hypothetical protein
LSQAFGTPAKGPDRIEPGPNDSLILQAQCKVFQQIRAWLLNLTDLSSLEPAKSTQKCKRKLKEITAELPLLELIQYTPLRSMPCEPELKIPKDLDIKSLYALFSLFFTKDILQTIAKSTNKYARRKRMKFENSIIQPRTWKKTNPVEIKVFLDILIYIEVY